MKGLALYPRFFAYLRPYWAWLLGGTGLAMVVAAMDGTVAWLVKPAMDEIFIKQDLLMLKLIPLALLGAYLLKGASRYGQSYLMASVGERVIAALRRDLYTHVQRMPLSFFADLHSAELMSRMINDVNRLARLSSQVLVMAVRQVATIAVLLAVMLLREWVLTLIAVVVFPFVGVAIRAIGRKLYKINRRAQEKIAELNVVLQESFTGTKVIKAFGREGLERERFGRVNLRLRDLSVKNHRTAEITEPLMEVLGALGIMGGFWYGGYQVIQGAMTPGAFFSFTAAVMMLYGPVRKLSRLANTVQQAAASMERVFEIVDTPPAIVDRPGARSLPPFSDCIEFEGVSFRYPDGTVPVLQQISLAIQKGEMVAFVGMSGAGKSTLMDLLPRFYDVSAGTIRIDGHDIRDVTQPSLRAQIGIVSQETFLFNDTVFYNIAYGKSGATPEQVEQAARLAHCHDFISAIPEGYQTPVGERGVKLSGGQRQRITIARAFLKDPPILILDEATSDLDAESEFMVQQALSDLTKGRTVLVIAHRLSTVRNADRIYVIHDGRIEAVGTHDELMVRHGLYRRLYALQIRDPRAEAGGLP
ncbi:MAG: ABC transporter ATP-binding protein [Candidatus Methylomirabilia bacterium]